MAEYIGREAAIKEITYSVASELATMAKDVAENLAAALAADMVPATHGRWVFDGAPFRGGMDYCHCSRCGKGIMWLYRTWYCPNCGAKMD